MDQERIEDVKAEYDTGKRKLIEVTFWQINDNVMPSILTILYLRT